MKAKFITTVHSAGGEQLAYAYTETRAEGLQHAAEYIETYKGGACPYLYESMSVVQMPYNNKFAPRVGLLLGRTLVADHES